MREMKTESTVVLLCLDIIAGSLHAVLSFQSSADFVYTLLLFTPNCLLSVVIYFFPSLDPHKLS